MKRHRQCVGLAIVVLTLIHGMTAINSTHAADAPPTYGYQIVNTYHHDRKAFCQGLAGSM